MPFIANYAHIVWATKYRQASITPAIETVILNAVYRKSKELNCQIHAINTAYDHLHVAVSIRLAILATDWIRQAKAISSHNVNHEFSNLENPFYWQRGYSYHSFGKKALQFVVSYIENQKHRHEINDLETYLEYIPEE